MQSLRASLTSASEKVNSQGPPPSRGSPRREHMCRLDLGAKESALPDKRPHKGPTSPKVAQSRLSDESSRALHVLLKRLISRKVTSADLRHAFHVSLSKPLAQCVTGLECLPDGKRPDEGGRCRSVGGSCVKVPPSTEAENTPPGNRPFGRRLTVSIAQHSTVVKVPDYRPAEYDLSQLRTRPLEGEGFCTAEPTPGESLDNGPVSSYQRAADPELGDFGRISGVELHPYYDVPRGFNSIKLMDISVPLHRDLDEGAKVKELKHKLKFFCIRKFVRDVGLCWCETPARNHGRSHSSTSCVAFTHQQLAHHSDLSSEDCVEDAETDVLPKGRLIVLYDATKLQWSLRILNMKLQQVVHLCFWSCSRYMLTQPLNEFVGDESRSISHSYFNSLNYISALIRAVLHFKCKRICNDENVRCLSSRLKFSGLEKNASGGPTDYVQSDEDAFQYIKETIIAPFVFWWRCKASDADAALVRGKKRDWVSHIPGVSLVSEGRRQSKRRKQRSWYRIQLWNCLLRLIMESDSFEDERNSTSKSCVYGTSPANAPSEFSRESVNEDLRWCRSTSEHKAFAADVSDHLCSLLFPKHLLTSCEKNPRSQYGQENSLPFSEERMSKSADFGTFKLHRCKCNSSVEPSGLCPTRAFDASCETCRLPVAHSRCFVIYPASDMLTANPSGASNKICKVPNKAAVRSTGTVCEEAVALQHEQIRTWFAWLIYQNNINP